ncbi:MAG: alpha/beta hydrolase [Noviherbaspirillum sp.]
MFNRSPVRVMAALSAILLSACAGLSPETRLRHADELAAASGWQRTLLDAEPFRLAAYLPAELRGAVLTIYIEGDGLAWISRSQASLDPTPLRPIALELALRHPNGAAAYLARPCQYVSGADARNCAPAYWTDARFAPEVVAAAGKAVDQLKARAGAGRLVLVGYSGGGAVAALVAAGRRDVDMLVTVAGNLDHRAWTAHHGVPPLTGSLNPADAWQALVGLPQRHLLGSEDRTINRASIASYIARFAPAQQPQLRIIDGYDHQCCWARDWPALLR